jgi:hypothetical protein
MILTLQLPDDQAAALQARAAAQGLSPAQWLARLAAQETPPAAARSAQSAVARILDLQKRVQPDPEGWTVHDYINHSRP